MPKAIPKVVFIVGQTYSGKTALGIQLAKTFDGEVINADARQIYKDFTIGTGKPQEGVWQKRNGQNVLVVDDVPHHLMDCISPEKVWTVAEWKKRAMTLIRRITAREHLPIVVGGTGLYVQTLTDNYRIPAIPPQLTFRAAMQSKSLEELAMLFREMDPEGARVVDLKNRRRIIRALEVVTFTGKSFTAQRVKQQPAVDPLLLALRRDKQELHGRMEKAIEEMITHGWIEEIRRLHAKGVPWDAPAMTSIGYRELSRYVQGACSLEEAVAKTKRATKQYAKRQLTWFKRDKRIRWVANEAEAERVVQRWLDPSV